VHSWTGLPSIEILDRRTPLKRPRPWPVTAIALYEFFRAAFILIVLLSTWLDPNGHLASRLNVQVLTYVVTRHNLSTFSALFMMPAGYLCLQRWLGTVVSEKVGTQCSHHHLSSDRGSLASPLLSRLGFGRHDTKDSASETICIRSNHN